MGLVGPRVSTTNESIRLLTPRGEQIVLGKLKSVKNRSTKDKIDPINTSLLFATQRRSDPNRDVLAGSSAQNLYSESFYTPKQALKLKVGERLADDLKHRTSTRQRIDN